MEDPEITQLCSLTLNLGFRYNEYLVRLSLGVLGLKSLL